MPAPVGWCHEDARSSGAEMNCQPPLSRWRPSSTVGPAPPSRGSPLLVGAWRREQGAYVLVTVDQGGDPFFPNRSLVSSQSRSISSGGRSEIRVRFLRVICSISEKRSLKRAVALRRASSG